MAVKNHNFRFNEEKEAERQAWEILHSKEVKEDFRSQNEFVIAAINDYYARHLATKQDPYLESREKEDAFVKGIVDAVEKKVLDNLPGLASMYMMQQQSLLSVLGLQGMVPVQQQMQVPVSVSPMAARMQQVGQVAIPAQEPGKGQGFMQESKLGTTVMNTNSDNHNYMEEDVKKYETEPESKEFLDFSFCGF